ncbi:helix-turn-helix domain-containing protein [Natrinema ejinorense]|uniref:Transcriptional regulator n=1 Tax=Natrinema ejinorense TaxID=373386 RepID=A0A2A5QSA6_9EURY|nr:helix-turn-helix domain-containing protein [Natrinema ejinorense]PCR89685.1 transcriptional regulator [Natrinema ejinorense]
MSSDDTDEHPVDGTEEDEEPIEGPDDFFADDGEGVGRAPTAEELDQRIVDLLSWILDTETRAKIYVYLLANPGSTSEEVAKGTGLYPSTVREALAELHDEDRVTREKRASDGAGNNPYEYAAIQPSELVGGVVDQVQHELNTIFRLDRVLDREPDRESSPDLEDDVEPVTITVDDTAPTADTDADSDDESGTDGDVIEFDDDGDADDDHSQPT